MPRWTVWTVLMSLSWTALAAAAPDGCYDWILKQKIRGGYLGAHSSRKAVELGKAAGMNLLMPKFGGLQAPPTEANWKLLREWCDAGRRAGIHILPVYNFRGGETEKLLSDRREVGPTGQRMERTPCPLDEPFWSKYIRGRAVALAERATELGYDGAIIDPEMYGADHTVFTSLCYCDDCFREFLAAAGQAVPNPLTPAAQRVEWLKAQQLTARYEKHFVDRVRGFSAQIEREVHARSPRFILGVLLLDYPLPFMRGMAEGLGTASHPVLGFSETTYSPGYTEYVNQQQQTFAGWGAQVLFVPGLWQQQFPSEHLAEQYYACAAHSAGYWVYTFESLVDDVSRYAGYQLREPLERYWTAMRTANTELDQLVASGGKHVSALTVRPFDPPLPVLTTSDLKIEPLVAVAGVQPLNLGPVTRPRLRYRNPVYILARAGEPVVAKVSSAQLANYRPGTQWVVVAPDGKRVADGHLKVRESAEVRFTPTTDGVYLLVAESGNNSHFVEVLSGQRWSFRASRELPLVVNGQFGRCYFHVPAGVTGFSVFAKAEGQAAGRGGKLAVYRPDGQVAGRLEGDLGSLTELKITVPADQQDRVWALLGEDLTNDLRVYLANGATTYLSSDPARVLRRP